METPASLASGQGGKLLVTERLSAFPVLVPVREGASGQVFAKEVERAVERARGDGLQERRLDELEAERRDARRASFGGERTNEARGQVVPAAFRGQHAPVDVEAATAPRPPGDGHIQTSQESTAPSTCTPCAEARPGASLDPVAQPSAGINPMPSASQSVAPGVVARSAHESPALAVAPASEGQPSELPQLARTGGKAVKNASTPQPALGPDPAVLERAAEILRQIQLHATPAVQRLTLDLEPAELGRLSVQLALRAGRVAAIVRGENPETLELLQQREAELLQVLAQRGIQADAVRFELGFGSSRSQRGARAAAATEAVPSAPTGPLRSTAPGDRSALIDLYA